MSIDRETLIAYADGELNDIERARVERAIAADPALGDEVAKHRRLRDRLAAAYAPVADAPVPERFARLLHEEPSVVSLDAAREKRRSRFAVPQWAAIAASLVIGLAVGQSLDRRDEGSIVIAGKLEHALDTQLASAQPADAAVRIGLSFRATDGALCRTFERRSLAGIACHEDGEWRLRRASWSPGQGTEYRQASSGEMAAAAQAMMAGEPFDAVAEKMARDRGWE